VAPFLAWAAWRSGEKDLAFEFLAKCPENFLTHNLRAEAAFEDKDAGSAVKHYLRSLDFEPGQPSLVYRLYEASRPRPDQGLLRDGRVHILFYTFNKLRITLDTLESLLATNIGQAEITLLNNGSTAFSPGDLDRGVENIAQGRKVRLIHLPANIGAPAARNWLWHLPETARAKYVAFLDDDVLLPENWLTCYLQDLSQNPETVAVGPKCVNPLPTRTVQYVGRFFNGTADHKILFTHNAPCLWDLGQYDHRRPCLSVMGCCHLFNRALCEKLNIPDFDICFSPSQVDDLEHDIQIWKAGGQVLYDGRVHVIHRQDVGSNQWVMNEADWGHVWGNHMKMEFKFSGRELQDIDKAVLQEDERFWRQCLETLGDMLPGPTRAFFGIPA